MMRSLYSGVAGLKTHQTRMDVIGNNISNVNTVSYKSQTVNFSDMLYQTTSAASGPNSATGAGGTNARQIGLGVKTAAVSTAITTAGAAQTTNNPFDILVTGSHSLLSMMATAISLPETVHSMWMHPVIWLCLLPAIMLWDGR